MEHSKITPALWYHTQDGTVLEIAAYYSLIFGNNFKMGMPIPLGNTPSGHAEMCKFHFFGNEYFIMSTEKEHHPFNDSFALMLHCDDQEEIDTYWDYFTQEGKPSQCGWCRDKYGLRWQIIPKNIGELMARPNAGQVMSKQTKIIIQEY